MFRFVFFAVAALAALAAAGCSTQVHHVMPARSLPACPAQVVYQVTVDSWCGNGCDRYPISHRAVDPRPENQRVVLEGSQAPVNCVVQ